MTMETLLESLSPEDLLPEEEKFWASCPTEAARIRVARDDVLSPAMQLLLSLDDYLDVRMALVENRSLTEEMQVRLACDSFAPARAALAKNPALTLPAQRILARDDIWEIQVSLAENPALAVDLQEELSFSPRTMLTWNLARNPSLVWSLGMSADMIDRFQRRFFLSQTAHLDQEICEGLLVSWTGSLGELIVATERLMLSSGPAS